MLGKVCPGWNFGCDIVLGLDKGVLVARVTTHPLCKVCTCIVKGCFAYVVKETKYRLGFCQAYL